VKFVVVYEKLTLRRQARISVNFYQFGFVWLPSVSNISLCRQSPEQPPCAPHFSTVVHDFPTAS